jgi:hypothetical protein
MSRVFSQVLNQKKGKDRESDRIEGEGERERERERERDFHYLMSVRRLS